MGVPSLVAWFLKTSANIFLNKCKYDHVDNLFLDFNAGLHLVAKHKEYNNIDDMYNDTIKYLDFIIKYINPKKLIYITIDGVAPLAKIKQQRQRRYKSILDRNVNNTPLQWDFNMISPATDFTKGLTNCINNYITTTSSSCSCKYIFTSANEYGEGEHKIIHYIKNNVTDNEYSIIYSLDSDIIFLSLSTHLNNILLFRENNKSDIKLDIDKNIYPIFNFLDISKVKKHILKYINPNNTFDTNRIIDDYIFISFMHGNDFLPPIEILQIKHDGINIVLNAYYKWKIDTKTKCDDYILDMNYNINLINFSNFLSFITDSEIDLLIDLEYNCKSNHMRSLSHYNNLNDNEKIKYDKDRIDHKPESIESFNIINYDVNGWEKRYYQYYFGESDGELGELNELNKCAIIELYIKMLYWNVKYYFGIISNWLFMYPYNRSPLLTDIRKQLNIPMMFIKESYKDINPPIDPDLQLLLIMPPQSMELIPKKYHEIIKNYPQYFPTTFKLDCNGKIFNWESHPILPKIDIQHLIDIYTQIKNIKIKLRFKSN